MPYACLQLDSRLPEPQNIYSAEQSTLKAVFAKKLPTDKESSL